MKRFFILVAILFFSSSLQDSCNENTDCEECSLQFGFEGACQWCSDSVCRSSCLPTTEPLQCELPRAGGVPGPVFPTTQPGVGTVAVNPTFPSVSQTLTQITAGSSTTVTTQATSVATTIASSTTMPSTTIATTIASSTTMPSTTVATTIPSSTTMPSATTVPSTTVATAVVTSSISHGFQEKTRTASVQAGVDDSSSTVTTDATTTVFTPQNIPSTSTASSTATSEDTATTSDDTDTDGETGETTDDTEVAESTAVPIGANKADTPSSGKNANSQAALIGGVVGGIGGCILLSVCLTLLFNIRRKKKRVETEDKPMTPAALETQPNPPTAPLIESKKELEADELPDVVITRKLGTGNFGEVYLGNCDGTPCACKKLSQGQNVEDFNREAQTLLKLSHPNIVLLMGIHTSAAGDKYMVFEYVEGGSLLDYLVRNRDTMDTEILTAMAIDAARGMVYLEKKGVIHRDVSARNFLISKQGVVKVSDFGMSRGNLYQSNDKQVPIRWAAPEMLNQQSVTSKSDSFSFGVFLWELYNFGLSPYTDLGNKQVIELVIQKKDNRELLDQPNNCPHAIYSMMKQCWSFNPDRRPNFVEILSTLQSAQSKNKEARIEGPMEEEVVESEAIYGNNTTQYQNTTGPSYSNVRL